MTGNWPKVWLERIEGQLGSELPDFLNAMESPAYRGIRFHPFRHPEGSLAEEGGKPVPWEPYGRYLAEESKAGSSVMHEAGVFYLQEPSAMIPAAVLDAQPGETVLDLCAAPGGKSTRMGCGMKGSGTLICNDPVPQRARVLSRNIERMGIPNAAVVCAFPEELAKRWQETFDAIMVDAPCSGEGMFRRHPETREEWTAEMARGCAARQREILNRAAEMLRPGGRIVYSTCTLNPEENEENVFAFLAAHPDFEAEPFLLPGISGADGCFTCWPHRTRGEGQFAAKLRKKGNAGGRKPSSAPQLHLSREEERLFRESGLPVPEPNCRIGDMLVKYDGCLDLSGLRVFRMGLHTADIRGKTVVPDHAAALAFTAENIPYVTVNGEEALRYMAGETLNRKDRGWIAVQYRGLLLGWGKGDGSTVKNHYPKGLRNGRLITESDDASAEREMK